MEILYLKILMLLKGVTALAELSIVDNEKLLNINGLSNLKIIFSNYSYGFSFISKNASLTNIDGLSSLESVYFDLEISDNPVLTNLNGLTHFRICQNLNIFNNNSLVNVDGLSGLTQLNGLFIYQNAALTNLNGLSHLRAVGILKIYKNTSLTQFCGLYNLFTVDTGTNDFRTIDIYDNAFNPTIQEIIDDGPCIEGNFIRIINFKNGGEVREASKLILNWSANVPYLNLEYRFEGSNEWNTIADNIRSTDSSYLWLVPEVNSYKKIFLKFSYSDNPAIYDTSEMPVTIKNVTLDFSNPSGGETYLSGDNVTINWHSFNAYKFKLEYTVNGGGSWLLLAKDITDSTFVWTAPNIISNHIEIKLSEQDLTGIYTDSKEFSITEGCNDQSIKLTGSREEKLVVPLSDPIQSYLNTNQLTFTAWVKLDSRHRVMPVINKLPGFGHFFWLNISDSILTFGYRYSITSIIIQSELSVPINIMPGKWYYIAAVRDDRSDKKALRLYLDGNLLDTTITYAFGSGFNNKPIVIGNDVDYMDNYRRSFSGQLSEVEMYNAALSSEQIKEGMFKQPDVNNPAYKNLVGYWKLSGNGRDFSMYKNDLVIEGNPAWTCDHPFLNSVVSDTTEWKVQIKGRIKNISDENNFAGVSDSASDNFDYQFDIPEPPAQPGSFIRVYFPHPEWNNNLGKDYTNDIRSNFNLKDSLKIWFFEVQSNIIDTVTLDFTKYNLPEDAKVYFSDLSSVERNNELPKEYKFFNSSSVPKKFMLLIGDTTFKGFTTVKLLQPNGGETWKSNTTKKIKWKLPVNNQLDSIFIYSAKNGIDYNIIGKTNGNITEFLWQTPKENWENNYRIKIITKDSSGNSSEVLSDGTFTIAGDSLAKKSKAGFSLISLPLQVNDSSRTSIFEDDFSASSYFVYSYSAANGYQTPEYLNFGQGYWLTLDKEITWDIKGNILEDDSVVINLNQGYNLIGNGYVRPLSKYKDLSFMYNGIEYSYQDAVKNEIITNKLYGTSGRFYYNLDILNPFEGYWVGAIKPNVKLIEYMPLINRQSLTSGDTVLNKQNWQIPISASSGELTDADNLFGVRSDASPGYDADYDSPEPPENPEGSSINLWFDIPNKYSEYFGSKFSSEFRAPVDIDFIFHVESTESGTVTLNWDASVLKNIGDVPLTLIDKSINKSLDMLGNSTYTYQNTGTREFEITGKTLTDVEKNNKPDQFSLAQNYPNPFNPSTTISYTLPEESVVEIKIYNTLGQTVSVIENSVKPAGYFNTVFDASNIAAGIYIYIMHAKAVNGSREFRAVKKLVLLK